MCLKITPLGCALRTHRSPAPPPPLLEPPDPQPDSFRNVHPPRGLLENQLTASLLLHEQGGEREEGEEIKMMMTYYFYYCYYYFGTSRHAFFKLLNCTLLFVINHVHILHYNGVGCVWCDLVSCVSG